MPRRHQQPESVHPGRWMVSYADLMTLLFAFFVVMYAISTVNNKKFDAISTSIVGVFDGTNKSLKPFQLEAIFPSLSPSSDVALIASKEGGQPEPPADVLELIQSTLSPLINAKKFNLTIDEEWVQLEIPIDALFSDKGVTLSYEGEQLLVKLAKSFMGFSNSINIEVFGDNKSSLGANPWLLTARQGGVLGQFLVLEEIPAQRLAVVSYGPFQPVATNDDEEGRAINRRVLFLIDRTTVNRERIKTVTNGHLSAKSL
jgi:chemotaxis protein MotB